MNYHPQWTDQAMSNLYAVWCALTIAPGLMMLMAHVGPLPVALLAGLAISTLIWLARARS